MTREKKEIFKKLDLIDLQEEADSSFGYWDSHMTDVFEEARKPLLERLAKIQNYNSVEDMLHDDRDTRVMFDRGYIPFI